MGKNQKQRILLLTTSRSYRGQAFMDAAARLDIEVVQGIDAPQALAEGITWGLGLDFNRPEEAVERIRRYAQDQPFTAVLAVDDSGGELAAKASAEFGLIHNSVAAAAAARDKFKMRQMLENGNVPSPWYRRFSAEDDPAVIAGSIPYPNVVKPLNLNGSRGVIRANDAAEFKTAVDRTTRLIRRIQGDREPCHYLVEAYLPGVEIALEGILEHGELHILAIFDKPDPLEGPFFEETIYLTPSSLAVETQEAVKTCTAAAAKALGLRTGPIHAELRINDDGPWIVEIAGRSIGGLCSQILQFGMGSSLEELILRQACGLDWQRLRPAEDPRGVMMIPIPAAGLLRRIDGLPQAKEVESIVDIKITAHIDNPLIPLPEGDAYLGFIFARGNTPQGVEDALREAHGKLKIISDPLLPIINL